MNSTLGLPPLGGFATEPALNEVEGMEISNFIKLQLGRVRLRHLRLLSGRRFLDERRFIALQFLQPVHGQIDHMPRIVSLK